MGICNLDNLDEDSIMTDCPSGYDVYYKSCCNHGMYVFWNVMAYVGLFACCMICCIMMAMRNRQMRS